MQNTSKAQESKGFYKLSWLQRIGFGSGDLAQNLIYQTICMYLLFFYTDIYGLPPGVAATMFLVVRLVDVLWDPLVGTYVDKHNPRWGKYRSYLVLAGIPLTVLAILCFWNGMAGQTDTVKLIYAYVTYVGLSMLYTLINVPYGALNSSLTRDTDEITILTSVRMFMANVGGLCVSAGVPILVAILAAAKDLPTEMALFMGLGSLPSFIFMPLVPAIKKKVGKKNMFYIFLTVAIVGMLLLYVISRMGPIKDHIVLVYIAQFIKSTGVIVATGYMWALIPEVISFAEYTTGKRISGIVNALTGIFYKAGMALGGVIPGLILAWTGYKASPQLTIEAENMAQVAVNHITKDIAQQQNYKDFDGDGFLDLTAFEAKTTDSISIQPSSSASVETIPNNINISLKIKYMAKDCDVIIILSQSFNNTHDERTIKLPATGNKWNTYELSEDSLKVQTCTPNERTWNSITISKQDNNSLFIDNIQYSTSHTKR